jgi:putative salt-induced outer membrane protein
MTGRRLRRAGFLLGLAGLAGEPALCPNAVRAEPLPPSVAAIIDAAAATGKPETLKTVVDLIKKTNPDSAAEIDDQVKASTAKAEKTRQEKLAKQGLFEGIKGEGQVGFSNSTGESKTVSLTAGLKLTKESLHWMNTLALNVDYERENGVNSEERIFVGYEGRYKVTKRQYILTTLSWERDPFAGFVGRAAGSLGLGYMLVDRPNLSLSLDAGPAVRRIAYVAAPETPAYSVNEAAGRVGSVFTWKITPRTVFSERIAGFFGNGDDSLTSVTALTTKLGGAISGRISYQLDYDSLLPPGYTDFETLGRLTLVYGF